jgi:hypothetical protein
MPPALTKTAWAKICAAAGRKPAAEAEARATLSRILYDEYPAFAYNRERVAKDIERAQQMLKQIDAFAKLYRQTFLPDLPVDQFEAILTSRASPFVANDVKAERDLWGIAGIRRRVLAKLQGALAQQEANNRNKSEQRAWLYHWLCEVWLDHFEGPELPPVGPPRTPLVNFMLAAMRLVMLPRDLPKSGTVRDNIDSQYEGRASLRAQDPRLRADSGFALKNRISKPA